MRSEGTWGNKSRCLASSVLLEDAGLWAPRGYYELSSEHSCPQWDPPPTTALPPSPRPPTNLAVPQGPHSTPLLCGNEHHLVSC